jgi:phosphatidylglycerophosphate synthase
VPRSAGSGVIKEKLGHRIDDWIHALFPFLFRRPVDPDLLTVVGTLVAASAGLAFAEGAFRLAGVLLLAGGFFDLVDGVVARHFGIATRFGAFLDSTLDRAVDVLVPLGLLVFYTRAESGTGVGLCTVVMVASVLTSYAKARAEGLIEGMPGGLLERGERIGLLAAGAILGLVWPVLWLLAIGTVVTAGQRFLYARREMARLDREQEG